MGGWAKFYANDYGGGNAVFATANYKNHAWKRKAGSVEDPIAEVAPKRAAVN